MSSSYVCVRRPPTVCYDHGTWHQSFPVVDPSTWCGEYLPAAPQNEGGHAIGPSSPPPFQQLPEPAVAAVRGVVSRSGMANYGWIWALWAIIILAGIVFSR
jgi:hypothetical protein